MLHRKMLLATSALVGGLSLTLAPGAMAQSSQPKTPAPAAAGDQPATTEPSQKAAAEESGSLPSTNMGEIVVTGSRLRRKEFTSASPVQVITSERSTLEGLLSTAATLQSTPIASGSLQVNGEFTGNVVTGGPGISSLSLRGIGAQRTLVLIDGRRVGPSGVGGTIGPVDLNVIPQSIISRTEILKDGASSIYGSDAIAGVVNLITKTDLDGGIIDASGNIPIDGGGESYRVSVAYGKKFNKGFLNGSLSYQGNQALRRGDRYNLRCAEDYVFDYALRDRADYVDPRTGRYACNNLLSNTAQVVGQAGTFQYPVAGVTYPTAAQGNDVPFAQVATAGFIRSGRAGFPLTYPYQNLDTPLVDRVTAVQPLTNYSATASGGYTFSKAFEVYGSFLFNRRETEQDSVRQLFPTINATNPNNVFGRSALPIIALPSDRSQNVNFYEGSAGVRGDLGDFSFLKNISYNAYGQYSYSKGDYTADIIYNDRVLATTGANVACNPALITISPQVACLSIPYFSQRVLAGNFNDAERQFLFTKETGHTTYNQFVLEGTVQAELFQLPAGAVSGLAGASYRRDEIDDRPGYNTANSNLYGSTSAGRTAGSDSVKEAFGEVSIPLLKDFPLVKAFTVEASGRYTDYDSYGSNGTYKVGLNWQISNEFRLRATKGTSYRAPALYEQYLANQTSFLGQASVDPCIRVEQSSNPNIVANCAKVGIGPGFTGGQGGSAIITTGGGRAILTAETSNAESVGAILSLEKLGFSLALDYFNIEVNNQVQTFGAGNIVNACYRATEFPNSPYCRLFVRNNNPASSNYLGIDSVNASYVNVASQINRGIDLNFNYRRDLGWWGKFNLDGQATWTLQAKTKLVANGAVSDFNGSTTEPDFTGAIQARLDRGPMTLSWTIDLIGKSSDTELLANGDRITSTKYSYAPGTTRDLYYKLYTEFTAYHNISIRYKFPQITALVGIRNLFDEQAPLQSTGQFRIGIRARPEYDLLGRQIFLNFSKQF